jgi:hypothetical protein
VNWISCCLHADKSLPKLPAPHERLSSCVVHHQVTGWKSIMPCKGPVEHSFKILQQIWQILSQRRVTTDNPTTDVILHTTALDNHSDISTLFNMHAVNFKTSWKTVSKCCTTRISHTNGHGTNQPSTHSCPVQEIRAERALAKPRALVHLLHLVKLRTASRLTPKAVH